MGDIFVIADLHLGHNNILKFYPDRCPYETIEEHDAWIVNQWNSVVDKRDVVYILGDVAFKKESLKILKKMKGQKFLVRGNHDKLSTQTYLDYFVQIYGGFKKKNVWLTHIPMHSNSLNGLLNVHGHVHKNTIDDDRYINVSVEVVNGIPQKLEDIIKRNNQMNKTQKNEMLAPFNDDEIWTEFCARQLNLINELDTDTLVDELICRGYDVTLKREGDLKQRLTQLEDKITKDLHCETNYNECRCKDV